MYVVYGWYFEQFKIAGVFDTKEKAQACAEELNDKTRWWFYISESYNLNQINKEAYDD